MMTSERTKHLVDVLESILEIAGNNISVKDAANFAFYEISVQYNDLHQNTVRDMFLRPSGSKKPIKSGELHDAIELLFAGNLFHFTNLYFTFIPSEFQNSVTRLCTKFKQSDKSPPIKSDNPTLKLFRHVRDNKLFGKPTFHTAIDYFLEMRFGHDAT